MSRCHAVSTPIPWFDAAELLLQERIPPRTTDRRGSSGRPGIAPFLGAELGIAP